jgi:ATP-dependent DNA helicase RecQ
MSTSDSSSTIFRPRPTAETTPIPEWMRVVPKAVAKSERPDDIAAELQEQGFDRALSRAIVFATSRDKTEELAADLGGRDGTCWKGRVGYFHAGMSAEDRASAYERFRDGQVALLCATKAFGMGMDLPNIHYVFHHRPPLSLEDYIQEVGRAGRSDEALSTAGFSEDQPVRCLLYAEESDFRALNDRIQKSRLSWDRLSDIQEVVHEYAAHLGHTDPPPERAFPVPMNLLARHDAFRDEWDPSSIQRMGLHWLERLGRIRQECYVPAHIELDNEDPEPERATRDDLRAPCQLVATKHRKSGPDEERLLVSTGALFNVLKIGTSAALFDRLAEAQCAGHLRVRRELSVRCTKQRLELVKETTRAHLFPPHLELAFTLAAEIGDALRTEQFFTLDAEWFASEVDQVAREQLNPSAWTWIDDESERRQLLEDVIDDLKRPARARAILFLVRKGPHVQFTRELEDNREVYELRFNTGARTPRKHMKRYLDAQRDLAERLIPYVYEKQERAEPIDLVEALLHFELDEGGIERFEHTLLFLQRMGYMLMSGGLLPMALETHLLSKEPIDITDRQGDDYAVYEKFQRAGRMKKLRLASLQVLAELDEREEQNRFVKQYMRSETGDDIFALLEEAGSSELTASLRQDALNAEEENLTEDQEAVYSAPLGQSTLVKAGPGSGKTHTLLLRLARLIHEENISPSRILVLAYNRAIVSEIKERLRTLLGKLGYRALSCALRVFTFHGLIRYALGDEVTAEDLGGEGESWVDQFNRIAEKRPGRIATQLTPQSIKYIFVDEYQDITEERYQMLRWIAGDSSRVTAIGDPDQSIYGYQRANAGQPRAADPFFDRFAEDFGAEQFSIADNFRSLPEIIETARALISRNEDHSLQPSFQARREADPKWDRADGYVQHLEHEKHAWLGKLQDLLNECGPEGRPHREVAVLFRSNAEVYRAHRLVHRQLGQVLQRCGIPVLVQGETRNWTNVREIAYCLERLEKAAEERSDAASFPLETPVWDEVIAPDESDSENGEGWPACWDKHMIRIMRFLVRRFQEDRDDRFALDALRDDLRDTLRSDQSQIYKLIQISQEGPAENDGVPSIVLANLHKVKGLEYDAVVIPASFQPLPFDFSRNAEAMPEEEVTDMLAEERRVYYVGMTRARDRLVHYEWEREKALREGRPFDQQAEKRNRIGLPFEGGDYEGHIAVSRCASDAFLTRTSKFRNPKAYVDYMHSEVATGDPVCLVREGRRWYVQHEDRIIAQLATSACNEVKDYLRNEAAGPRSADRLDGLSVSNVSRYPYEESLRYDEENGTDHSEQWAGYFKHIGYTYVVTFAGFARLPKD